MRKAAQEGHLLTTRELAALLNVKPGRVYGLTAQGKIPHYKVGGLNRYDKEEVLAALRVEKRQVEPGSLVRLWAEGFGIPRAKPRRSSRR